MSYRVLVADDDPRSREALLEFLTREGHETLLASGGIEALRIAGRVETALDLSILDINMPDLDGIETYKRILERRRVLPCIFITADASPGLRTRAMDTGAYTIIPKPVRLDLLRFALEEALR